MDKFIALYYLAILPLVVFMSDVFLQLWLDFYNHSSWNEKRVIYRHSCVFCSSVRVQLYSKPFKAFLFFFLGHSYLDGLSSLGWMRVQIFNSLERFKAIYPCYVFIIPSESHFLPSAKFQRPKMFTSDIFSDSTIKVIPRSINIVEKRWNLEQLESFSLIQFQDQNFVFHFCFSSLAEHLIYKNSFYIHSSHYVFWISF